jgi:hypothetical protein
MAYHSIIEGDGNGWYLDDSTGDLVFLLRNTVIHRILKAGGVTSGGTITGADLVSTDDVTVGDDLVVTDDAAVGGVLTPTGGIAAAGGFAAYATAVHTGGGAAMAATDGNDSTPVVTEIYISEIFVPSNMSVTGIAVLNGSVASDDWHRALLDKDGAKVTGSDTGAVTSSGTDAYQKVPFSGGAVTVLGPATYYIAQICDGVVDRYNTHAIGAFVAGKITGQTYGAIPAANTLPSGFTANLGPIASLY